MGKVVRVKKFEFHTKSYTHEIIGPFFFKNKIARLACEATIRDLFKQLGVKDGSLWTCGMESVDSIQAGAEATESLGKALKQINDATGRLTDERFVTMNDFKTESYVERLETARLIDKQQSKEIDPVEFYGPEEQGIGLKGGRDLVDSYKALQGQVKKPNPAILADERALWPGPLNDHHKPVDGEWVKAVGGEVWHKTASATYFVLSASGFDLVFNPHKNVCYLDGAQEKIFLDVVPMTRGAVNNLYHSLTGEILSEK